MIGLKRLAGGLLLSLLYSLLCLGANGSVAADVAKSFLPPGSRMVQLEKYDPKTGKVTGSEPAAIACHILSPESDDIIFAYETPEGDAHNKVLFVDLLHKSEQRYVKLQELSYYGEHLWTQDFATIGLKLIHPPESRTDAVAVMTGIGAALGGQLQVFKWDPDFGLRDVMPENGSVKKFYFTQEKNGVRIRLSFERYPGDREAPAAIIYLWDGKNASKVS